MKNAIKNFIRNIVFDVVKEFQENVFTEYRFIENGKEVFKSEMHIKPQPGDTILVDDSLDSGKWFKFVVKEIEYSQTGFTGNIIGTCFDLEQIGDTLVTIERDGQFVSEEDKDKMLQNKHDTLHEDKKCSECGCSLPDGFLRRACYGCD